MSPVQPQYLEYVLEQLSGLGTLRSNRMFGGVGLYADGLFFGLIDDDTLFFKTSEANIAGYRERNMPRFMPFPDRPEAVLGYHQVPADVIEDAETLVSWARQSVAVALAAQASKVKRARPPRRTRPPERTATAKPRKTKPQRAKKESPRTSASRVARKSARKNKVRKRARKK